MNMKFLIKLYEIPLKQLRYSVLILLLSACISQNNSLIYNSEGNLEFKDHFEDCIKSANYSSLFDHRSRKEEVYFEYFPAVKVEVGCEGIYYYNYVSKSFPKPLYRDSTGKTYSKYFLFIIQNGEITSLTNKSKSSRKQFFEKNQDYLKTQYGETKVRELKSEIINGFKLFY